MNDQKNEDRKLIAQEMRKKNHQVLQAEQELNQETIDGSYRRRFLERQICDYHFDSQLQLLIEKDWFYMFDDKNTTWLINPDKKKQLIVNENFISWIEKSLRKNYWKTVREFCQILGANPDDPIHRLEIVKMLANKIIEDWHPQAGLGYNREYYQMKNGWWKIQTGEFTRECPNRRNLYYMMDMTYDENYQDQGENGLLLQMLRQAFPEQVDFDNFQKWAGSIFFRGVEKMKPMLLIFGLGNTGKSMFVEAILRLFNEYNPIKENCYSCRTTTTVLIKNNFAIGDIENKMVVLLEDGIPDKTKQQWFDTLKNLVSTGVRCERKYKSSYSIIFDGNFVITSNDTYSLPKDEANRRRQIRINWGRTKEHQKSFTDEQIVNFPSLIANEFLRFAQIGYQKWCQDYHCAEFVSGFDQTKYNSDLTYANGALQHFFDDKGRYCERWENGVRTDYYRGVIHSSYTDNQGKYHSVIEPPEDYVYNQQRDNGWYIKISVLEQIYKIFRNSNTKLELFRELGNEQLEQKRYYSYYGFERIANRLEYEHRLYRNADQERYIRFDLDVGDRLFDYRELPQEFYNYGDIRNR